MNLRSGKLINMSSINQNLSSTLRQKVGRQSVTYVAALTTPQGVTSKKPSTAATSQPLRASAASSDVTSSTQIGRKERQPLVMSTSFIRQ